MIDLPFGADLTLALRAAAILAAAVPGALLLHLLLIRLLRRLAPRAYGELEESLIRHGRTPLRVLLVLAAIYLVIPLLRLAAPVAAGCGTPSSSASSWPPPG